MLEHAECNAISDKMKRLSAAELRAKVRGYPAILEHMSQIRDRERKLGLPELHISEEGLIDRRRELLIGKLVRGILTEDEEREFVELGAIRVELMTPKILRRISRRRLQRSS